MFALSFVVRSEVLHLAITHDEMGYSIEGNSLGMTMDAVCSRPMHTSCIFFIQHKLLFVTVVLSLSFLFTTL